MGTFDDTPLGLERDFLNGRLLLAMPHMRDKRFERAAILICAHDAEHAMGLVINKPIDDLVLSELLEQMDIDADDSADDMPVYYGGPVQTDRGYVLHTLDYHVDGTSMVTSDIGLTATRDVLTDLAGAHPRRPRPDNALLALGYAGWSAGQLEDELQQNAWAHCDITEELLFATRPESIWLKGLESLGVDGARLSAAWASARDADAPLH